MKRPREIERPGAGNAEPVEVKTFGKVEDQYPESGAPATVTDFPRSWKARRSRAAHRKSELIRLCRGRRAFGLLVDPNSAAWALAATLGSAEAGPYKIAGRQRFVRWCGLDLGSLRHAIEAAELGQFDDEELVGIMADIERNHARRGPDLMSGAKMGKLLQVTAAEREEFGLRTIEACDETRDERRERQAETRKASDAERKRAQRGRVPRQIYEGRSLSAAKPWEAEGVSRSTWYERRRTGVSADPLYMDARTHLSDRVSEGTARFGSLDRSGGANGPSPGGKLIELAARRAGGAAASEGADWLQDGDLVPSVEKPAPGEPPCPPLSGRAAVVVALAERAQEIPLPRSTMTALGLSALMLRISNETEPDDVAELADTIALELRSLLKPHAANDNRVGAIIRRLAA